MPLSVEQKKEILDLLDEGMERNAIASQLGVTPGQVSAVKAHRSMGSYDQVEQEPPSPRAEALIQQVRAPIDEFAAEANTIQVEDNSDSEDAPVPGLGMAPVAQVEHFEPPIIEVVPGTETPPVLLGNDIESSNQIYWQPDPNAGTPNPHALILGNSGAGKTYAVQCMVAELAQGGVPSLIFDYGQGFDLNSVEKEFIDMASPIEIEVGRQGVAINPLQLFPSDVHGPVNVAQRMADTFLSVYPRMGIQQHSIIRQAVIDSMRDGGIRHEDPNTWILPPPPFSSLLERLQRIAANRENPHRRHAASAASHIATIFVFNTFNENGVPLDWGSIMNNRNRAVILRLSGLEKTLEKAVTEFLLWNLYGYVESLGPSNGKIRCFTVLDEAHRLSFSEDAPTGKFLREARKFGLGLILASQQTTDFSMVALSNTATKLVFQTLDPMGTISRLLVQHTSINLTANEVKETLKALPRGRCMSALSQGTCFTSISSFEQRSNH